MRQKFGQHFLRDKNIARKIVAAAALHGSDTVIEIGPGKGVLTELISPCVKELIAVEIDRNLARQLGMKYASLPSVNVVNENFMAYELPDRPFKIIANLPYYLSTAIVQKFLSSPHWSCAVVMMQKEVAERITAEPGTGVYGALSVFCRYFSEPKILFKVLPDSFLPPPKVDSAVVFLSNLCPKKPDPSLFPFVRLCFRQRRKTILNSLAHGLDLPKPQIAEILRRSGIDPSVRPEDLNLSAFQDLTSLLENYSIVK